MDLAGREVGDQADDPDGSGQQDAAELYNDSDTHGLQRRPGRGQGATELAVASGLTEEQTHRKAEEQAHDRNEDGAGDRTEQPPEDRSFGDLMLFELAPGQHRGGRPA